MLKVLGGLVIITVIVAGIYQGEYHGEKIIGNLLSGGIKMVSEKTYYEMKYPELKEIRYQHDYDEAMKSIRLVEKAQEDMEKRTKKFGDEKTLGFWELGKILYNQKDIMKPQEWNSLTVNAKKEWLDLAITSLETYARLEKLDDSEKINYLIDYYVERKKSLQ